MYHKGMMNEMPADVFRSAARPDTPLILPVGHGT
jgi:hypothetical protein